MCILAVADKRRPKDEELEKMHKANGHGGGIAWREGGYVKWEKGLTLDEMKVLCANAPLPFVFHFRIASCGGQTKELTHPFPVEKEMRTDLSGQIKGYVLFHNGHWSAYKDKGLDATIKNRVRVPDGDWSDTRVMAWLAHLHGPNILRLIDEKVVLFGLDKIQVFHQEGWTRVDDLLVSNQAWCHVYTGSGYGGPYGGNSRIVDNFPCTYGNCKNPRVGGTIYCEEHVGLCSVKHCLDKKAGNTSYCLKHQPLCCEVKCTKPRLPDEKYCDEHLKEQEKKEEQKAGEPGGAPTVVPFHHGTEVASGRSDRQPGTEAVRAEVAEVATGVPGDAIDPVAAEASRWAKSINPRVYRAPHLMQLIKRPN